MFHHIYKSFSNYRNYIKFIQGMMKYVYILIEMDTFDFFYKTLKLKTS